MSARVVYWNTACLEPRIEAVSKEIFELAARFPGSRVFAVSPNTPLRVRNGGRVVGAPISLDPLLRLVIPLYERLGDINHVYAEVSPWIFHKTLHRNPIVLTVASEKGDAVPEFLERCRTIVAQTRGFARKLTELGVPKSRVEWIPPGVDLQRFRPREREVRPLAREVLVGAAAAGRAAARGGRLPTAGAGTARRTPRVLFASAPRTAEEMEGRGVHLLVAAARACPDVHFRFLYRTFATGYTSLPPTRELVAGIPNIELTDGAVTDMSAVYPSYDFTVIPYLRPDGGKECPNSLLEGLACGVPALVSTEASVWEYVAEQDCGVVFEPTPEGLARAVSTGMSRLATLRANARAAAERDFDLRGALGRYERIYERCRA